MSAPISKNETELTYRRQLVAEYYLKGKTQTETAKLVTEIIGVDVSQRTVSSDLKAVREEWKQRSSALISEHLAEELAKIDGLERRYNQLYEKSTGKNGTRYGDIKYLLRVEWCIDRRCLLLGVDSPKRLWLEGVNGGPIETKDVRERFVSKITGMFTREQAAGTDKPV
jgi:hypothetical protein